MDGILYVGYNLAVYPASFFTLTWLESKKDSIYIGIISGIMMTIPWFLTYFAILAYYPDPKVIEAPVPWLVMLDPFDNWFIVVFGIVVGWTLVETATGVIHAFIGRLQIDIKQEMGRFPFRYAARAHFTYCTGCCIAFCQRWE